MEIDAEDRLRRSYEIIMSELYDLMDQSNQFNRSMVLRYIWYSVGEVIIQSVDGVNSDGGFDVCGVMLNLLTGSNSRCHDIIYHIRDYNSDYEMTLDRMALSGKFQEVGRDWKEIVKSGDLDNIRNMSDVLKRYSVDFLPNVKKYIEYWNETYYGNCNKKALDRIIKDKSNAIKQYLNIVNGYLEVINDLD